MKALYLAIQAKLLTLLGGDGLVLFKHSAVWNNQFQQLQAREQAVINFPNVFIELLSPTPSRQLGDGSQIYDLLVRIHIGHRQDDSGTGTLDQNLDVFDLKDKVYKLLQDFKPAGCINFCRSADIQDIVHNNVYEYILEFKTNLIDQIRQEPVDSVPTVPPTQMDIDIEIQDSDNPQPHVYPNQNP